MERIKDRKIVVINQAVNYLTIGLCNAFADRFTNVSLVTGGIHEQGESLNSSINVENIVKFKRQSSGKKFINYAIACSQIWWLLITKYRKHEVFFLSLPAMGYLLNLLVKNRFSILIWDVYPDTFKITGMSEKNRVYKIWSALNKKSFAKAYKIFSIGEVMADLLSQYVDRKKIIVQPIWSIFQTNGRIAKSENHFIRKHNLLNKFVIQYSGNVGLTHKVELMIELADKLKEHEHLVFMIIGKGPRIPGLMKMVEEKGLNNCLFLPFQPDEMFPYSLSTADLGVVILDETISKGSVPSKSYNLMAYGIPALYISSNDSELYNCAIKYQHARCFSESALKEAVQFILQISEDTDYWKSMSENAEKASEDFRRLNADKIVAKYLEPHKEYDQ